MAMKKTIYLPDDLAKRIEQRLQQKGEEQDSFSQFVQKAIEKELREKDISHFLRFAGVVKEAPHHADEEAEDW